MLNLDLIERLYDAKAFDRLLDAVVANGLELPLPLRVRLSQAPAGAVAVALRRAVQLAYGQSDLTDRMAKPLLAAQEDDGSFDSDPLITAAAVAAWGRLLADRRAEPDSPVAHAREAAMACQWLGLEYAIPCHHDDPTLPEIVRFRDILIEARQADPTVPEPIVLKPGETFSLG